MAIPPDKAAPPLWVWSVLTVLVAFCTAAVYLYERYMQGEEYPAKTAYLLQRCRERPRDPLILVLGSSMTQCALDSTTALEHKIGDLAGRTPVLVKIWKPAAKLSDLVDAMPHLKDVCPAILVVEANMLFYLPDAIPLDSRLYSAFNQLARGRFRQMYFPDVKPNRSMLEGDKDMSAYREGLVDTSQLRKFRELAAYYQWRGTRIMLVNIPLKPVEEFEKWQRADTAVFNANLHFLQEKIKFDYLRPALPLSDSSYIDKGHLNANGTDIYSAWLVPVLAKELQAR